MKIDLDELERKANTADQALWDSLDADASNSDRWDDPKSQANAQHIAANGPLVTLALIARIRELEAALGAARKELGNAAGLQHVQSLRDLLFAVEAATDAVISKGAVLP